MLYDADCSVCTATAAWVARRVPAALVEPLALQDAGSDRRLAALIAGRPLLEILHVALPDGRVVTGAAAVLAVGRLVPRWRWLARAVDNPAGRALLEPLYRVLARRRRAIGRLLGLPATCPMPAASERPRSS